MINLWSKSQYGFCEKHPIITQPLDLLHNAADLTIYAKDPQYNADTKRMVFHLHIWSFVFLVNLKEKNSPQYPAIKAVYHQFLHEC